MRIASDKNGGDIHSIASARIVFWHERIGQAYFNAAYTLDPEWANKVRSTDLDPFHDNTILGEFLLAWYREHDK